MRLSNFRKQFPNLKAELSSSSNSIQDVQNQNQNYTNYTNINVGGNEREVLTNEERAASQRDLHLTNRKQVLLGRGKRKVESDMFNCKKRRENTDFGGQHKDQT